MGDILIFPASPSDIRDFIRKQAVCGRAGKPIKPQTLKRMLQVITNLHTKVLEIEDPCKHLLVTSEMKALYRVKGSRPQSIIPLRLKGDVADIINDDPLPGSIIAMLRKLETDKSGWTLRARVILGIGADTGRNRSDYIRLNIGDVVRMPDGSGRATFRGEQLETIQASPKYISPDTMSFIDEWLSWREKVLSGSTGADEPMIVRITQKGDPAERLSKEGFIDVLQDIMKRVGNGAKVSGNSFRAGLKMDLEAIGTSKLGIANSLDNKVII